MRWIKGAGAYEATFNCADEDERQEGRLGTKARDAKTRNSTGKGGGALRPWTWSVPLAITQRIRQEGEQEVTGSSLLFETMFSRCLDREWIPRATFCP
jgi:hypothetical protein